MTSTIVKIFLETEAHLGRALDQREATLVANALSLADDATLAAVVGQLAVAESLAELACEVEARTGTSRWQPLLHAIRTARSEREPFPCAVPSA